MRGLSCCLRTACMLQRSAQLRDLSPPLRCGPGSVARAASRRNRAWPGWLPFPCHHISVSPCHWSRNSLLPYTYRLGCIAWMASPINHTRGWPNAASASPWTRALCRHRFDSLLLARNCVGMISPASSSSAPTESIVRLDREKR
jgi:hypothetical protein